MSDLSKFITNLPEKEKEFDAEEEWKWAKMPKYNNKKIEAYKSIILHFGSKKAMDDFAILINQPITEATKYIKIPFVPKENLMNWEYVNLEVDDTNES